VSSVHYQFISNAQTSWCQSRTCDLCKKTIERQGPMPKNEPQGGISSRFVEGVFHGWVSISFRFEPLNGDPPRDIYLDVCDGCRPVLFDVWVIHGLDWSKDTSKTIYLDANGNVVENPDELLGRPMCVWRAEGKIGIRPCRRFKGHEGECSLEPEGHPCPLCTSAQWLDDASTLIYSPRALEHHAQAAHWFHHTEEGWFRTFHNDPFGPFPTVREALDAVAALDEVHP